MTQLVMAEARRAPFPPALLDRAIEPRDETFGTRHDAYVGALAEVLEQEPRSYATDGVVQRVVPGASPSTWR